MDIVVCDWLSYGGPPSAELLLGEEESLLPAEEVIINVTSLPVRDARRISSSWGLWCVSSDVDESSFL